MTQMKLDAIASRDAKMNRMILRPLRKIKMAMAMAMSIWRGQVTVRKTS
ncbi:hypothetical protein PC116_g34309 [Phytophthora cactorum]|nr:hypothetical protein PC116_g34309 [Phytophthora cactorum]